MPNLGAGVDPHYNLTPSAALVFTPTPGVTATVRVFNEGQYPLYVGGSGVTPNNGFPVQPNCRIEMPSVTQTVYACGSYATTATATTTTAAANAAATTLAVTSGTGFVNGAWVLVGAGANAEAVQLVSGGGTTTLTVTALLYDHKSGAAVAVVTAQQAQLHVTAGVV